MRLVIYFLLTVWLFCLTMTQRAQTDALQIQAYILSQHEENIRDLQRHVEPNTHFNQAEPTNPFEPGSVIYDQ